MENAKQRVLAHGLCRELSFDELNAIAGASPTSTTITSGGNTCHDSDDTSGTVSECK